MAKKERIFLGSCLILLSFGSYFDFVVSLAMRVFLFFYIILLSLDSWCNDIIIVSQAFPYLSPLYLVKVPLTLPWLLCSICMNSLTFDVVHPQVRLTPLPVYQYQYTKLSYCACVALELSSNEKFGCLSSILFSIAKHRILHAAMVTHLVKAHGFQNKVTPTPFWLSWPTFRWLQSTSLKL